VLQIIADPTAGLIDWKFELGALYHETLGRPSKPMRPMVGLTYLKHNYKVSDEQVCEHWLEHPYWQFFCDFAGAFRSSCFDSRATHLQITGDSHIESCFRQSTIQSHF
jgi:hypothetical protein